MALVDNFPFHFQLSYWPVQPSFSGFRCMRLTKRPTSNTEWWCHSIRAVPAAPSPSFFAHVPRRAVIIVIQYLCSRGVLLFEPLSFLLLSLFYAGFLLSFCALAPSFYPSSLLLQRLWDRGFFRVRFLDGPPPNGQQQWQWEVNVEVRPFHCGVLV